MEKIRFNYSFTPNGSDMPDSDICMNISHECGLNIEDVCDTFLDFMEAAGFSSNAVYAYFQNT